MKSVYIFIQKYIDIWDALAVICYSVFTWCWSGQVKSNITEILSGISTEGSVIEIVPLGNGYFYLLFIFLSFAESSVKIEEC